MMKKLLYTIAIVFAITTIANAQSGRVGIGTSAPKTKLDVAGAISTSEQVLPAENSLSITSNISLFRISAVASAQTNSITAAGSAEGQLLIIVNEDNDDATFAGTIIKASGGSNSYVYANGNWRLSGTSQIGGPPTGAAGGDLTGTYPNPTVATSAINSTKILDGTIVNADIANSTIDLTNKVNNVLPVANGGSGVNTITGVVVGNGGSPMTGTVHSGGNQVLRRNNANSAYEFAQVAYGDVSGTPSGLPPTGTAGGDLSGSYPNPQIATGTIINSDLANMGANTVKGNATNASAVPTDVGIGTNTVLGRQGGDIVATQVVTAQITDANVTTAKIADGNVTTVKILDANVTTAKIADGNVTYAKLQNVTATRLLGNPTGSAAAPSEISLGAGLSISGTTLNTENNGTVTSVSGTAPITSSGGATPAISISGATGSAAGSMSAADKAKLDSITGTNTGDQTITLTADVTGSGTGSFATTISANAVTSAKILDNEIVNADINSAAAIDRTKLVSGSNNHVVINNGSGVMSSEAQLALSRGGTNADLSATGGTNQFLKQSTTGGAVTVGAITAADVPGAWSTTGNSGTTPSVAAIGTAITTGSNFIGTSDNKDLVIATNNGTNTLERVRISSSGNVGIGNTNPTGGMLHVTESSSSTTIAGIQIDESDIGNALVINESGNGAGISVTASDNGAAIFSSAQGAVTTGPTGHLFQDIRTSSIALVNKTGTSITSTGTWNGAGATNTGLSVLVSGGTTNYAALFNGGNVGIGTTTPGGRLDVVGGRSFFAPGGEQYGIGVKYISTGGAVYFGATDGSGAPNAAISNSAGTTLMTLQNGGNVGIGTTGPGTKLDVNGNIAASGNINMAWGDRTAYIQFPDAYTATPTYAMGISVGSGQRRLFIDNKNGDASAINPNGGITFRTGVSGALNERMHIASDGNVGIGNTSPKASLSVGSASSGDFINLYNTGVNTLMIQTTLDDQPLSTTYGAAQENRLCLQPLIGRVGIGTTTPLGQFELSLNEGRKPTSTAWTIPSDERLKTIHGSYNKGLKEILLLQPITYNYKNVGDHKFAEPVLKELAYGFSAQEVKKIFPECVGTDDDGYLNFNMHAINVAYVNAIKELNQKIELLSKENELLKAQSAKGNALEEKYNKLSASVELLQQIIKTRSEK